MAKDTEAGKVWLITGSATGLGRAIAEEALGRGDRVVITARGLDRLQSLAERSPSHVLPCQLDVTSQQDITATVSAAIERFGRIDVLVNNAASGLLGAVEESSGDEIRSLFDSNVFGPWELVRAVLPHMRRQRSGTIVNVSSFAALCAFTGLGVYSASKFALEGMSEALAAEVRQWGIGVIIAEPGGLATEFASHSIRFSKPLDDYEHLLGNMRRAMGKVRVPGLGDPAVAASVIVDAVQADNPPLRLALGRDAVAMAEESRRRRDVDLDRWREQGIRVTPYTANQDI